MDTQQIIGWNLRRLRVAVSISQETLANEAHVDRAYVGRIERGEENVTVKVLSALAHVLDVPVIELFRQPPDGAELNVRLKSGRKRKGEKPLR